MSKKYIRHGMRKTRLYQIYHKMRARCYNPNCPEFKYYGGRGISICKEWLESFVVFKDWALKNGYADNLSIDRVKVNAGYSPDNCRWATPKQQSRNRRSNIYFTHNNKTMCLLEWCENLKLPYKTIEMRINRGWDIGRALFTPIRGWCHNE